MSIALELDREVWSIIDAPRRKRGRPKGSRNKPKPTAAKAPRTSDRDSQMIVMRESGARLEDIGAAFGLTRERARQCLAQLGYTDRRSTDVDPIRVLRAARAPQVKSLRAVADDLGMCSEAVAKVVRELGVSAALQRLYRWRRRSAARRRAIACLQEFVVRNGRGPTIKELGFVAGTRGLPELRAARTNYNKVFPSFRAMLAAAGIASRPAGYHGRVGSK